MSGCLERLNELVELMNQYGDVPPHERPKCFYDKLNDISKRSEEYHKKNPMIGDAPKSEARITRNTQEDVYWKLIDKRLKKNGIRL